MLIPWYPWHEPAEDTSRDDVDDTENLRKLYTARNVLKTVHILCLMVGMVFCFFPHLLLKVLHADEFSGEATTALYLAMGLLGNQIFAISSIWGDIARDGVSVRVQSVGALCAAINFSTIALSNIYLMAVGKMPLAIPRETVVTITGVALVAGGLCLAGWVIGGSVLPNRRALVPKGKAKWPLLIGIAGLSACAIACSFYPRQLAEVINPGVLDSLPGATTATLGAKQGVKDFFENVQGAAASSFGGKKGVKDAVEGMQGAAANSLGSKKGVKDVMDNLPSAPNALHGVKKSVKDAYDNLPSASTTFHGAKKGADELLAPIGELSGPVPMIVMMILHAGRAMGLVILGTLAICSVGDEEVSYRLLRCWCLSCAFSFGMLAKDNVLMSATGWPSPRYNLLFAIHFVVTFCMVDAMAAIPFKLVHPKTVSVGRKDTVSSEQGTPEKQGAGAAKAKKVK